MNTLSARFRKQLLVAGCTLGVVLTVVGGFFLARSATQDQEHILIRYAEGDSADQTQAQGIEALRVVERYRFSEVREQQLGALVTNPNSLWHASHVTYRFVLQGPDGQQEVLKGSSFIGAASERLIIASFSDRDFIVENVSFSIESVDWVDASSRGVPNLRVRRTVFETTDSHTSRLEGSVVNDSDFGAADVEVGVVVLGSDGAALGAGLAKLSAIGAGEEEAIEYLWERSLEGMGDILFFPVAESVSG